jgi:hypothetical protein
MNLLVLQQGLMEEARGQFAVKRPIQIEWIGIFA